MSLLYAILHCRQAAHAAVAEQREDWVHARDFVRRLSAANRGTGSWESGWVVTSSEMDGSFLVEKDGLRLCTAATEFRAAASPAGPRTTGAVRLPKEYLEQFTGQYMALGNADLPPGPDILRLYWHIKADAAAPLTSELTARLNDAGTPFRLKLLGDPVNYRRADAAVLYLPRSHGDSEAESIAIVYQQLRRGIRPSTSAFTKRLAPGLGLAEEPGNGTSFGQHRSELLAAALTSPQAVGATSATARRSAVTTWLVRQGYDPGKPYLSPRSTDTYTTLGEAVASVV